MDQTYMKEQPVLKLIVSMALPMVISMMVSSLYNIVDSFFIARISEDAMTALSLVYPVQNLINAVMIGFGIGINAVISFYLGAQDKKMADRALECLTPEEEAVLYKALGKVKEFFDQENEAARG